MLPGFPAEPFVDENGWIWHPNGVQFPPLAIDISEWEDDWKDSILSQFPADDSILT